MRITRNSNYLLRRRKGRCELKLWIDTSQIRSPGTQIRAKVTEMTAKVNRQVLSRGTRAVNAMRNAELEVLSGSRGGRSYRKYPYKSSYTASAPGEPPARRSGNLRLHWTGNVEGGSSGSGTAITCVIEANEFYAGYLEYGTRKMARRPYAEKIAEKALPQVEAIFAEPYL